MWRQYNGRQVHANAPEAQNSLPVQLLESTINDWNVVTTKVYSTACNYRVIICNEFWWDCMSDGKECLTLFAIDGTAVRPVETQRITDPALICTRYRINQRRRRTSLIGHTYDAFSLHTAHSVDARYRTAVPAP